MSKSYRSSEAKKRRSKESNDRSKIQRAFYHLLYNGLAPKKVVELRKVLKKELDNRGSNITLKRLNEFPKIWHPKYRDLENVYRCYGGLIGTYMQSEESRNKGIFMLKGNKGILPFELCKGFSTHTRYKIAPVGGGFVPDQRYAVQLVGMKENPYYNIISLRDYWSSCSFIKYEGNFQVQGIISSKSKKDSSISVTLGPQADDAKVKIYDFPHPLKKKEFWVMECDFRDMQLVYKRGISLI